MDQAEEPSPVVLKELGNNAVKESKFTEAILHYTHAIKLDPDNYTLYSNRSYAFLKEQQYYFALEDANVAIRLNPSWPKGFFRKGEVEYATGHYIAAYEAYRLALKLKPEDANIVEALNRSAREILREKEADAKIPWLGAGIGIVIGVVIVIADCLFTLKPTHPLLMALVTIVIALVGYGVARSYRSYVKCQRDGLLEPPPDLTGTEKDENEESEDKSTKKTPRYTKSQARLRYKKGKL
ncbi:uncharacterized protein LOC132701882 [Cylas formicarius]|uniref:uncharacterized protein LOC132701882 n=1 Tax=Cylas formicarius TaxID=197179 RepID=UPI0029585886|nr:uncharacterized protein LOC132701882 [Cylas formicarius]